MKKRRLVVFSIITIITLVIFIYTKQENQGQQQQVETYEEDVVAKTSLSEEVIDTDDNSIEDDLVADVVDILVDESGSGYYGEPAAKLDAVYEDAMANSNLEPFEKELIRLIVEKEGKSFEEALESVRPGSKVVEQTETQTPSNNQKPGNNTKPTTPTKPTNPPKNDNTTPKTNEGPAGGADFNNSGNNGTNKTEKEKQMEQDFFNKNNGGYEGGPGGDTSHEPDL